MKKHLITIAAVLLLVVGAGSTVALADTVVTDKNIQDGLNACKEYPVYLSLDGEAITFEEKDVPPVIITPEGEVNGRTLIPARALFEKAGATVNWNNDTQSVEIKYNDYTVLLTIGSQTATVNGEAKTLEVPALIIDHDGDYFGSTMIPVRFAAENLNFGVDWDNDARTVKVTSPPDDNANRGDSGRPSTTTNAGVTTNPAITTGSSVDNPAGTTTTEPTIIEGVLFPAYDMTTLPALTEHAKTKIVVIDTGHGGKDPGAVGHEGKADEVLEKDVNFAVGLMVRDHLVSVGADVRMLKETDTYMAAKYDRPYAANDLGADMLVSIHNNSDYSSSLQGTTVCYRNKTDENGLTLEQLYGYDSKTLAKNIQSEMVEALGTVDRGISNRNNLAVLNKSVMPAVIVEGAFLSNESDFTMIKTDEYKARYAYATAKAIIETLNAAYPDEYSVAE